MVKRSNILPRLLILAGLVLGVGCTQDFSADGAGGGIPLREDPRPIGLESPYLRLGVGIETGYQSLSWASVPGATSYTLESDYDSLFLVPLIIDMGQNMRYELGHPPAGFDQYFRVRAETPYLVSRWSNVVRVSGPAWLKRTTSQR